MSVAGVVDSHVHLIGDPLRFPLHPVALPGDAWYRESPVDRDEFCVLMAQAGVGHAVLVQPVGAYGDDNSYALELGEQEPDRFAAVCMIDPRGPEPAARLRRCVVERGARGVRLFAIREPASESIASPLYAPLWAVAAELAIPVVVTLWSHQFDALRSVLEAAPIPVVLDHCGFPDFDADPEATQELLRLAAFERLSLKVTTNVLDAYAASGRRPQELVTALVSEFGSERVIWGSDFAQTHGRPYPALVEQGRSAFSLLKPADREQVLGGNARRLWWAG